MNVKWPWLGCGPGGSTKNMKLIKVNITHRNTAIDGL